MATYRPGPPEGGTIERGDEDRGGDPRRLDRPDDPLFDPGVVGRAAFDLKVELDTALEVCQRLGQRRDPLAGVPRVKPSADIALSEFREREAADTPPESGCPLEGKVVEDDRVAVPALVDIALDHLGSQGRGPVKGRECVFRRLGRSAAVGNNQDCQLPNYSTRMLS